MSATALKAHFDGEHIVLDEPAELAPNTRLLVTVVPAPVETPSPASTPPKFDYMGRLKAIYGDYVMSDEEFDEILGRSRSSVHEERP